MSIVLFGNHSFFRFGLILPLLLCALLAYPAQAGTTVTFATQGDYTSAVGTELFFVDFNNSPGTTVLGNSIDPNIVFTSPEAANPSEVLWNSDALSNADSPSVPNGAGPIEGVFNTPLQAFSFDFIGPTVPETVWLYDSSDNLIDTLTAPNPSGFFGVTSATPVARFRIYPGQKNGLQERVFLDDFQANAIPEPVAMSLMLIGGLALLRKL